MTNNRIVTGVKTLGGNDPWAQGKSFQTVEQLQAQIASLTEENERLTNAATNLLSALQEYRAFKPDEDCDGGEDERMRIFETLNMTEAELIAALQPKEGNP